MISATFQLTQDDIKEGLAALSATTAQTQSRKPNAARGALGWLVFIGLAVFLFLHFDAKRKHRQDDLPDRPFQHRTLLIIGAVSTPAWMIMFFGVISFQRRRVTRNQETLTIALLEEGYSVTYAGITRITPWNRLQGFAETHTLFLIRESAQHVHFLPKRHLSNPQVIAETRFFLTSKLAQPI